MQSMKEAEEADVREWTANKTIALLLLTLMVGPDNFDAAHLNLCGAAPKAKRLKTNQYGNRCC